MSHFILHTKEKTCFKYLMAGIACILMVGTVCFTVHSIGIARAKSREVVLIYTREELEQYLLDQESEEYNRNGRYRLEEDLDLDGLYQSIGTNLEPFTGTFDGNGHVINGLVRPLFGVIKNAKVENLFLSGTVMTDPFTYYDGEYYVDGYGALAAYAVDSVIQNCGMNGEIRTASPVEAEYQLAKASPAEAEEHRGPGREDDISTQPGDEISKESTSTTGPENDVTDASAKASELADGPGMESNGGQTQETGSSEETKESGETESGGQEVPPAGSDDAGNVTIPADNESGGEGVDVPSGIETTGREETETAGGSAPEASEPEDGGENTPEASEPEDGGENTSEASGPEGGEGKIPEFSEPESESRNTAEVSEEAGGTEDISSGSRINAPADNTPVIKDCISETIGYRTKERQYLMMKVPAVSDSDVEEALKATPSDATPSDAEEPANGEIDASKENLTGSEGEIVTQESETIEYIGNPNGDIYILVTAERVTAGGLVAQTSGTTLISDCFTLVDMKSHLETIETYAGGFAGILGGETRIGNSYASGLADSDGVTGGFAAVNHGIIENCYSSIVLVEDGTECGAFTADGEGSLSGCVYDRQMAGVNTVTENEEEIVVKGIDSFQMTGMEPEIPGTWYVTEHAYPQLDYFAHSENGIITAASRASAIALLLPEGTTLFDVMTNSDIIIPSEIDGEVIDWDVEGDDDHQVKINQAATISLNQVPEVGAPFWAGEEETENASETEVDLNNIRLKATLGNVSRNFSITARTAVPADTSYANWEEVGEKLYTAGTRISGGTGTPEDPYRISTAGELGIFVYLVNQGNWYLCAQLEHDISLIGSEYGVDYSEANPLPWTPIAPGAFHGDTSETFKGTFDGQFHTISNVDFTGSFTKDVQYGFFGILTGTVRNLYLDEINLNVTTSSYVCMGAIAGQTVGTAKVDNCGIRSGSLKGSFGGAFSAVGGLIGDMRDKASVENCFNRASVICSSAGSALGHSSGIVGRQSLGGIKNCYNTGSISGGWADGIASKHRGTLSSISNCFAETGTSPVTYSKAQTLSKDAIQSWAAAYALNEQSLDGVWTYHSGGYPEFGVLTRPDSWLFVGQGVLDKLIAGVSFSRDLESGAYNVGSAEQLAAFAAQVNNGSVDSKANLTLDINLIGERYGGTMASPILWYPIGDTTNVYKGTFDGNGKAIGYMTVEQDGYAGMFSCAGGGAVIAGVGIDSSCKVTSTGTTAGDGTAALVGLVKSDGTAVMQITIQNCYSRAAVTSSGTASATGAFVGNYSGSAGGSEKIANCYNTGMIKVSGGSAGAVAGTFFHGTDGGIKNCYWDSETSGSVLGAVIAGGATVENCSGKATAAMKSDDPSEILDPLNANLSTGTWYRVDKRNDGYPIFMKSESEVTWEDVGAAVMAPRSKNSSSTPGTEDDPYQIWTTEELAWFAYQVNHVSGQTGLCAELMTDIDLFGGTYSGHAYDPNAADYLSKALLWGPVGNGVVSYTGTFYGNSHTVSVMRAGTTSDEKQGLFGTIGNGAVIAGLTVAESQVSAIRYGGGIAGYIDGNGVKISDCQISEKLEGKGDYFGGIAGYVGGTETEITGCRNTGEIAGTGSYIGGIAGTAQSTGSIVIEGCYNSAAGKTGTTGGAKSYIGGILGGDMAGSGTVTIRNCYNQGTVHTDNSGSQVGGIAGNALQTTEIRGCYNTGQVTGSGGECQSIAGSNAGTGNITYCFYQDGCPVDGDAKKVSQTGLQTWAAAYALNGHIRTQSTGISWTYDLSGTGYPVLTTESLPAPSSWEQVGEGLEYGLLDSGKTKPGGTGTAGDPYQIRDAEQLAWVAYLVNRNNAANRGACVDLNADINLFGQQYTEFTGENTLSNIDQALSWMPMGEEGSSYCGTFNGNGHEIDGMYINGAGYLGLFGEIQYPANIQRLGIGANSKVTGTGSNCALLAGTVALSGTGSIEIHDCYTLGTVESSGSYSGAFIGDDVGKTSQLSGTISNCYHAGSAKAFANLGAGKIENCYADITVNSNNAVCEKGSGNGVTGLTTGQMKTNIPVAGMNKQSDGSLKTGTGRVWYTSLDDEPLNGYPTFKAPATVAVEFIPDTPEAGSQVSLPGNLSVADMKLRSFGSVDSTFTPGSTAAAGDEFNLTAYTDLTGADSDYHKYGYTNANQKLAFQAGGKDLLGLTGLLNNPTTDLGTVSSVSLGRAAAYTKPEDRYVLLEGASGTDRYEIQITVKGVTSKTLSVTMPVEVAMAQLTPDGTDHVDYSVALNIKNNNAYPIDGKIVRAVPRSGNGYVPLKPVTGTLPKNREITDASGGVRLGLANQPGSSTPLAANIYYDPDAVASGKSWLEYRLKHGGILPYRYVMEYSGLHFSGAVDRFAYDISYGFAVSESNYTDAADVIVTP